MNRSCRSLLCTLIASLAFSQIGAEIARGQSTPPRATGIPQTIKDATTISPADRTTIANSVDPRVQQLLSNDPKAISTARESLINDVVAPNKTPIGSPTFQDNYASVLDASLGKAIAEASPLARLNAAIVVARVAEAVQTSQLRGIAAKLVADSEQPVVLWGMRAAKGIVPPIVKNPVLANDAALRKAIATAVTKHSDGILAGDIAREAYEALMLDALNPNVRVNLTPQMVLAVVPHLHDVMRARLNVYTKGIPASPLAELNGVNFLLDSNRWNAQSKQQQLTTVQLISDLLSLASQQAAAAKKPELQAELVRVVDLVAGAVSILGGYPGVNSPALTEAADAIRERGMTPQAKAEAAAKILPALQKVQGLEGLKPAPAVTGNAEPTTEPTTIPATTAPAEPSSGPPAAPAPTAPPTAAPAPAAP